MRVLEGLKIVTMGPNDPKFEAKFFSLSKQLEQLIQVPDWVMFCEGFRRIKIHPRPNLGDDFTW